ncbi:hypothetical protein ACFPN2_22170 [Steroidobacter flavus]|uniref:Beta-lactamase-related domain-containing protein n=1 Tax=Steroidobacter flavus TaxID=1842136 RepID=A0ABV8SXQ7_9GAMM
MPSEPIIPSAFTDVDSAARETYNEHRVPMGVAVYDGQGTKVFEQMYGDFSPESTRGDRFRFQAAKWPPPE